MTFDPYLEKAFWRLDQWRHLPAYRLEPRADVFFAAFLPDILAEKLDHPIREPIIPEFPLRRGTLYGEETRGANASVKVDYLAVTQDSARAYLVELKTDGASRRSEQDDYLDLAVSKGVPALARGVLAIVSATSESYLPKYMHLLERLQQLGWIDVPEGLARQIRVGGRSTSAAQLNGIRVLPSVAKVTLSKVYIQPVAEPGICCISFKDVSEVVAATGSPLGKLFAAHLERWVVAAGSLVPGEVNG